MKGTPDLSVRAGGIALRNPVVAASGTFGYGTETHGLVRLDRIGGFVAKSLSLQPRAGHPPPRLHESPSGMLNAIGLENVGVAAFLREKLPRVARAPCAVIASVFGERIEEYRDVAARLDGARGLAGLELNLSCPHVARGGAEFGVDPGMVERVTAAVRPATRLPLWVKLSPHAPDVGETARAAEAAGADAVSLINTIAALSIDVRTRRPRLKNVLGGLSGPALKPIAVRMVRQAARAVKIPVVGMGGIATAEDALEFVLAGATAVQVGTANFVDPGAMERIARGIRDYLADEGVARVTDLIGAAFR